MGFPNHLSSFLCTFFLILGYLHRVSCDPGTVGVNYGRIADNLPPPPQVVQLLKAQGITKIKLYDTDSTVLSALSGSGITVIVALPNEELAPAAADQAYTDNWVQTNIVPYHPSTLISAIAVGNEVFVDPQNTTAFLVPAIQNVYASLVKFNMASSIKVSSPIALSALESSYPSSAGAFKSDLIEPVIKPMLSFLQRTDSYLMVNAYPFFAYIANTDTISLDYALFRNNAGVVDTNNGIVYKSLFEAQIDAVFAAMGAVGFNDIKIVISETGWPSKGDENEIGANQANAAAYNGNLVRRILTGGGTPLHPDEPLDVYLFALFNENQKTGATSERNYGLFYPNEQKVYDIALTVEGLGMNNESKVVAQLPRSGGDTGGGSNGGQTWCVANDKVDEEKLQQALDYACGEGGADCGPIQSGGACYKPNNLVAHASYAFNSFYQRNGRGHWTCDFAGAAYVVTQSPKFGGCKFPISN